MKIIGIMITMNDMEIASDWLKKYRQEFDELYVLDNSNDKFLSEELFLMHSCVYHHQSEYPDIVCRDHPLRKVIYDMATQNLEEPDDTWFVIAHPDEFYTHKLKYSIEECKKKNCDLILMNNCHNFPHTSELEEWKKTKSHRSFHHFVCPGHIENRIFKYRESLRYDEETHSLVIPHGKYREFRSNHNMLHYKIVNIERFDKEGCSADSSFASIKSHYPPNHKFNEVEDFFIKKPGGLYAKHKVLVVETPLT